MPNANNAHRYTQDTKVQQSRLTLLNKNIDMINYVRWQVIGSFIHVKLNREIPPEIVKQWFSVDYESVGQVPRA